MYTSLENALQLQLRRLGVAQTNKLETMHYYSNKTYITIVTMVLPKQNGVTYHLQEPTGTLQITRSLFQQREKSTKLPQPKPIRSCVALDTSKFLHPIREALQVFITSPVEELKSVQTGRLSLDVHKGTKKKKHGGKKIIVF